MSHDRVAVATQAGARGDGIADDTAAIQALLANPEVEVIQFAGGRYRVRELFLRRRCHLVGQGAELIYAGDADDTSLLRADASGIVIEGLSFVGAVYRSHDDRVTPEALLRIDPVPGREVQDVRLVDLRFTGGQYGLVVGLAEAVFIERLSFDSCRTYGLVLKRGPQRVIINGLIAHRIGFYGGIKTDYAGTTRVTEQLVINDFVISDCGGSTPIRHTAKKASISSVASHANSCSAMDRSTAAEMAASSSRQEET